MIKKILLTLLILFIAAAVAIFVFGSKLLNELIIQGVEIVGPQVTQSPVTLENVDISVFSGKGSLQGLYVGNPEGFKNDNIFELGQIDVEIDAKSLLTEKIIVKEIIIRNPAISYEKGLKGSNLKTLMANIEAFTGPAAPEEETAPVEETGEATPAPQVVIEHLVIEGGSIYVGLLGVGQTIPLPRIEMNDIGAGEERMSAAEMINLILGKIVTSIGPAIADSSEILTDGGKAIGNAAGDTVNAAGDAAGDAVKKATDSIKSLFGK